MYRIVPINTINGGAIIFSLTVDKILTFLTVQIEKSNYHADIGLAIMLTLFLTEFLSYKKAGSMSGEINKILTKQCTCVLFFIQVLQR